MTLRFMLVAALLAAAGCATGSSVGQQGQPETAAEAKKPGECLASCEAHPKAALLPCAPEVQAEGVASAAKAVHQPGEAASLSGVAAEGVAMCTRMFCKSGCCNVCNAAQVLAERADALIDVPRVVLRGSLGTVQLGCHGDEKLQCCALGPGTKIAVTGRWKSATELDVESACLLP